MLDSSADYNSDMGSDSATQCCWTAVLTTIVTSDLIPPPGSVQVHKDRGTNMPQSLGVVGVTEEHGTIMG